MSNGKKNIGNKKPDVENLRGKHRRDSKAYEKAQAARALEAAKKKEGQEGKKPKFIKQGITGAMLKKK